MAFHFPIRRNFLWHTSCGSYSVAKKFNALGMAYNGADTAAMQLRLATMPLASLRVPPRVRTVPMLRRRLPVAFVNGSTQPVKIRHPSQNLGSPVNETRPSQSPRV